MEEVDELEANWLAGLGAELANDLLGKTTPLFFSPDTAQSEHNAPCDSTINKLISTVYSGPTISEIENALSLSFQSGESYGRKSSRSIISLPEKGIGKIESKYTLRIKSCRSGLADDGYKWRKYGQKSIKNSPNPRSYYRCTNPRCNAKKQVERSMEDPETFIVSYEGLHLHYTYSHFLLSQPQDSLSTAGLHMQKKSKIQATNPEGLDMETKTQSPTTKRQEQQQNEMVGQENKQEGLPKDFTAEGPVIGEERLQHVLMFEEEQSPQGLLEDVVPLLVRKPCSSTTSSNELSSSYSQSSSPSYSSSLSWPPTNCYLDVDILSSIILETSW